MKMPNNFDLDEAQKHLIAAGKLNIDACQLSCGLTGNRSFTGLPLHEHQIEGVDAILGWHAKGHGGILADEMGLGKTCQVTSARWTDARFIYRLGHPRTEHSCFGGTQAEHHHLSAVRIGPLGERARQVAQCWHSIDRW